MTWVIGTAQHPSGAVLVADVRVSFTGSGVERDMLQKIHPVAPNIACAFAGSVRVGFEMVESLRAYIAASSWGACPPTGRIVHTWWRHARRAWTQVDAEAKKLGCSLIIAGAQAPHGFVHKNIAYRLRHPKFELERIDREPRAIGSGNQVEAYRKLLGQSGFEWYQQYPQLMQTGAGPLAPFGAILADAVTKNPAKGVSPHLHLCVVRCHDIQWGTNDTTLKNGHHGRCHPSLTPGQRSKPSPAKLAPRARRPRRRPLAEEASIENPYLAAWSGRRLPLIDSEPGAADLDARVAAERLPGLADPAERARFVRELEHSARRIDALARLADDPGPVDVREPAEAWTPLPAIVQWTRSGDRDEATWLAYLTTAFGPDERRGHETWYGTRVLYSGFGEGRVAWRDVADDPASLLALCQRHASKYAQLPRGNHRKNEPRFDPDHPRGLCASVRDLVALADAHGGLAR